MCHHITYIFFCDHTQKTRVKCHNRRTRRCMPCRHEVKCESLCRECCNMKGHFKQEHWRNQYEPWFQSLVHEYWHEFISPQFPELRTMDHSASMPSHPSMRRVRGSTNLAQEYRAEHSDNSNTRPQTQHPTANLATTHSALLGTQAFPAELAANGENDLVKGGPLGSESNPAELPAELPAPFHGPVRSARRRDSFSLDSITEAISRLTHSRARRNA